MKTPEERTPDRGGYVTIPMCHLSDASIAWLYTYATAEKFPDEPSVEGFFVWALPTLHTKDIPDDLAACARYALDHGCHLIFFEQNKAPLDDLPVLREKIADMKAVWFSNSGNDLFIQQTDDAGCVFRAFMTGATKQDVGEANWRVFEVNLDFLKIKEKTLDYIANKVDYQSLSSLKREMPFTWGRHITWICCSFAKHVLEALGVLTPVAAFESEEEAARFIGDNFAKLTLPLDMVRDLSGPLLVEYCNPDICENRWFVVDASSGKILDNGAGNGYETEEAAEAGWTAVRPDQPLAMEWA